MRRLYRIFVVRLTLVATFSCAVATQSQWLVPSCYATTSEAQQEADQKVSLSADKIIEILRQDPGQLLQVKRMLIQKAYEQGRILESSDLTDEALFRQLREDEVVRALATRVVENRFYVRAKPARQEIEGKRPEVDDQSQGPEPDRPTQKSPTSDQVQRANGREDDCVRQMRCSSFPSAVAMPNVESVPTW